MTEADRSSPSSDSYDEETAALLLDSDRPDEIREGFRQVYGHYREPLLKHLAYTWRIRETDRDDVLDQVVLALYRMVGEGRFDPNRPIGPLLFTIARRRAIDWWRRRTRRSRDVPYFENDESEAMAKLGAVLAETKAGRAWSQCESEAERNECLSRIRQALNDLPPRQRLVMEVQLACPERELSLNELVSLASRVAAEPLTKVAVKRARQEARKKVEGVLEQKGYLRRGTV